MHSLPLFHRLAGERVVVIGDGDAAAAKRRLVERAGGVCCGEDEEAARLGFVALEDREQAEAAAAQLKARGLLVNVADRPELCDFTLPSVLERGDVLVAVNTGGASAGLAKQLRLRLEALLPSSLAALARGLFDAREEMRRRWPDAAVRRGAIDSALAEGGVLDPLAPDSAERVAVWLANPGVRLDRATAEIVLTSDDPDDLTLREARLLGCADTIVHDAAVAPAILARARADAVRVASAESGFPNEGLTVRIRRTAPGSDSQP